ncbi:hypothetical protein Emag_001917 [Eimeria magna]
MSGGKDAARPPLSWSAALEKDFSCAIITGFTTATVFNPWDKALYLSVKDRRPFLDPLNWKQPFSGLMQAISSRTLNTGLYFLLESFFHDLVERHREPSSCVTPHERSESHSSQKPRTISLFIAGNLAGVTCAALSHPLNVTKYSSWNGIDQGFYGTVRRLYLQGGPATLYRGLIATLVRDSFFGGVYSCFRHNLMCRLGTSSYGSGSLLAGSRSSSSPGLVDETSSDRSTLLKVFALNTVAAGIAVALSSPLNYVRNMQLAAAPDAAVPRMLPLLRQLRAQAAEANDLSARIKIVSRSLLVGWGSLRAAMGMGFGSLVYDLCKHGGSVLG